MLSVTAMSGFGATVGVSPVTVSYEDSPVDTSTATEYTFSSAAFGTAAANRKIVVIASGNNGGDGKRTATSMTIGGVTGTELLEQHSDNGGQNNCTITMYIAAVPTGTTGDIVMTWSGGFTRCGCGVWAIYGANSTPHDTAVSDIGDSAAVNILTCSVEAGGVIIGGTHRSDNSASSTWALLTEDFDEAIEGAEFQSGASGAFAAAVTDRAVTATGSSSSQNNIGIIASFSIG